MAPARLGGALQAARERLQRRLAGDAGGPADTPALDAEVLLRHVLGLSRSALFARLDGAITPEAQARYAALVARRAAGEPVAYLTGEREFMGLPFAVGGTVLIPRPETETLVERALARLATRPARGGATVVDVGTGSGAIAVSVAALAPPGAARLIVATDRSADALRVAQGNARRLLAPSGADPAGADPAGGGASPSAVHFVRCSLLSAVRGPIDLLLANLPYIPTSALATLPVSVKRYEPRMALDGGEDGLDLYQDLLADLPGKVAPGATLLLECDPGQVPALSALVEGVLPGVTVTVVPDLAGYERVVEGRLGPPVAGGGERG